MKKWVFEKNQFQKINIKDAIFDFNVGYLGTIILGICFVLLGALVMFNTGETFSNKGNVFAAQLIDLYTRNLGNFSYIFIAIAAFTTMFSTTLTTLDASPRAMNRMSKLLFNEPFTYGYWFWILLLLAGTLFIMFFYISDMGILVKFATILSFLTAPFYAILNFLLVTGKHMPKEHHPGMPLKILSLFGILFLIGFSIWFLTTI